MAYGIDLRQRGLNGCKQRMKLADVAAKYEVSQSFVEKLLYRWRTTGEIRPKEYKHGPKEKLKDHENRLRKLVPENPDATLSEIRDELKVDVSISTIWNALNRLDLTFKKNAGCRRAKAERCAGTTRGMANGANEA